MISKRKIKISPITETAANNKYICKKNKCKYDSVKKEVEFDSNSKTGATGGAFVLAHDFVSVLAQTEISGLLLTETANELEEFETEALRTARIVELGLIEQTN